MRGSNQDHFCIFGLDCAIILLSPLYHVNSTVELWKLNELASSFHLPHFNWLSTSSLQLPLLTWMIPPWHTKTTILWARERNKTACSKNKVSLKFLLSLWNVFPISFLKFWLASQALILRKKPRSLSFLFNGALVMRPFHLRYTIDELFKFWNDLSSSHTEEFILELHQIKHAERITRL